MSVRPAELHFLKSQPVVPMVATAVTLAPEPKVVEVLPEPATMAAPTPAAAKTPTGQQHANSSVFLESLPRFVSRRDYLVLLVFPIYI